MIKTIQYFIISLLFSLISGCFLFAHKNQIVEKPPSPAPIIEQTPERQKHTAKEYEKSELNRESSRVSTYVKYGDTSELDNNKSEVITKTSQTINSQMFQVNMAFALKDKTQIDQPIKAELLIDTKKDLRTLIDNIQVEGTVISNKIKVSKVLVAQLHAPSFTITNITPNEQPLNNEETTKWLWTMQPNSTGTHEVILTINAVVRVDNSEKVWNINTYEEKVLVTITPQQMLEQWIMHNWQWIISTLLLPFGIWWFNVYMESKRLRNQAQS